MGKLIISSVLVVAVVAYLLVFCGDGFDPETVRNQRVLVTGASAGIGEQLAYEYAKLGARLLLTARRKDVLQNVSKTCLQLGAKQVDFVAADMADSRDRDRVVAYAEKRLGGLDLLVLNHALQSNFWWLGSAENMTILEQIIRVNYVASVDLVSKMMSMLVTSRGRIGVVSSIFGKFSAARTNAYGASKCALQGFFSSLRQELRLKNTGVSVTLAVLGPIATDTLLSYKDQGYEHLPNSMLPTPAETARAILRNVEQRSYSFTFDWKLRYFLLLNDFFPEYFEDLFTEIMQNKGRMWLARLVLFMMSMLPAE